MKKAIAILLAALMLLTLFAACSKKKSSKSSNSLVGTWTLTGVADNEEMNAYYQSQLAAGAKMTITLNADKTAVLYSTDGSYEDTMNCTYTAENGKLTLNPPAEYADDDPEVMNYRIENGKLYLSQGEGQYSMTMIFEKNK